MRKMEIAEIDSQCYMITTTDFRFSDVIKYNWDSTTRRFEGEYQYATADKRKFQKEYFTFEDYPTIGDAINFIWQREREMVDAAWQNLVNSRRRA